VERGFLSGEEPSREGRFVVIPIAARDGERGCLVIEAGAVSGELSTLCRIFGQQVGQALENLTLWERATTDSLTGLHNRAFGAQRLDEVRALDLRRARPTSVLIIDVDRFKQVNDEFGHAAGDTTLRAVGNAVQRAARRSDVVARWGGEELLIVLPDTSAEMARLAAERVRSEVSMVTVTHGERVICVTVSIGTATAASGDRQAMEWVVAAADRALYAAKAAGRDRVCEADNG
jgi:diguanylate cyclase (GGDEF)-like protein